MTTLSLSAFGLMLPGIFMVVLALATVFAFIGWVYSPMSRSYEREAREQEARDQEASEQEVRDQEASEQEARDQEAREQEARAIRRMIEDAVNTELNRRQALAPTEQSRLSDTLT